MALSGDEIAQITSIVDSSQDRLFDRLSEKLDLTVNPVKETLMAHMAHDEKADSNMYKSLNNLEVGQTALKTQMHIASFVGGSACVGLIGLFFGVVKDLI